MVVHAQPLDINILPRRYRPRRVRLAVVGAVLVVALVLAGLLPVYNVLTETRGRSDYLEGRLAQGKAALSEVQARQVRAQEQTAELEGQTVQVRAESERIRVELSTLSQQRTVRADGLAMAIAVLVPRVRLVRIQQAGGLYTVEGEAGSQALVLDYARLLQDSGQYANVRIVSLVNVDPLGIAPDVRFAIALER